MKRVAIITDSNSGITQTEAKEMGIFVLPMPFTINDIDYFEDINLTQEQFYVKLMEGADVMTSQPSPDSVMELWDRVLKEYDEIVHIPMSSGLSGSTQTAMMLAEDYEGKVFVVDNQRISITQRNSVKDALNLVAAGYGAEKIKEILTLDKFNSSIYIMLDTLKYLKKGGRITPAAAAIGELLRLKPVLQIQGEKLDAFAKARTVSQAKNIMLSQIKADAENRFGGLSPENVSIMMAYTYDIEPALQWREEILKELPGYDIIINPLSLSVSCHIGQGALAIACCQNLKIK